MAFWTRLLERVHAERPGWTKARKPTPDNWMTMPSPFKGGGVSYSLNFPAGGRLRYELYIDNGDGDANLGLFNGLRARQADIESAFGSPLAWEELPGKRACRIAAYGTGDVANTDEHDAYVDWFIDAGTKLRQALDPYATVTPSRPDGPLAADEPADDEL